MLWIGLTGPMACGKSSVARLLAQYPSIKVIDADLLARLALSDDSPLVGKCLERWGEAAMSMGRLDRKKVAQIIFGQALEKKWLESLIHPLVQSQVDQQKAEAQANGYGIAIYDVPLLFENQIENQFDAVVLVACQRETQRFRAQLRDQLSADELDQRHANQLPLDYKLARSDYVIWNDHQTPWSQLEGEVKKLRDWLLARQSASP